MRPRAAGADESCCPPRPAPPSETETPSKLGAPTQRGTPKRQVPAHAGQGRRHRAVPWGVGGRERHGAHSGPEHPPSHGRSSSCHSRRTSRGTWGRSGGAPARGTAAVRALARHAGGIHRLGAGPSGCQEAKGGRRRPACRPGVLTFMSAGEQGALQCRQLRLRSGHWCSRWCSFSPRRTRPLHAGHSVSMNGHCPSWQLWQQREWVSAGQWRDSGRVQATGPPRSLRRPCSRAEIRTRVQPAEPHLLDTEGTVRGAQRQRDRLSEDERQRRATPAQATARRRPSPHPPGAEAMGDVAGDAGSQPGAPNDQPGPGCPRRGDDVGGCAAAVRARPAGHWGGHGVREEAEAAGAERKGGPENGRGGGRRGQAETRRAVRKPGRKGRRKRQ